MAAGAWSGGGREASGGVAGTSTTSTCG
uniref:Uncharacterized protein n=1 Tax=Arundo donax TaxID=35708 RepID=A0A0A9C0U7_ARUDO